MEMTLKNRVALGRWWFQNRSLSPMPLLVLLLLVRPDFEMTFSFFLLGAVGVFLAEGLRLLAVSFAGSGTRTRGDDVNQLVTGGPYRWIRNPLYLANILLYASFSFLFGHILVTALAIAYFSFQYSLIVSYEETLLQTKFGERYQLYCDRVPRWLIGQRVLVSNENQSPDFRAAIRSERSTLIAIGAMWFLWVSRFIWRRN